MCLHSASVQSAQIDKFIEHGMPQKIVKTVKYTLKKRAADHKRKEAYAAAQATDKHESVNALLDSNNNNSSEEEEQQQQQHETTNVSLVSTLYAAAAPPASSLLSASNYSSEEEILCCNCTCHTKTAKQMKPIKQTNIETAATIALLPPQALPSSTATATATAATQNALKIPKLCGRFRQLQQQQQQQQQQLQHTKDSSSVSSIGADNRIASSNFLATSSMQNEKVYVDALAVGTQLTKQFAQRLQRTLETLQSSKIYILLTKTTQPAHVIAIGILLFVLLTIGPHLIDSTSAAMGGAHSSIKTDDIMIAEKQLQYQDAGKRNNNNSLAVLAYLGAFATHFGAQIWMTFVSGLSLYFSLPRHTFGQCQQILFPKYFALNAMLSIGMLILFVKYFFSSWNITACVQLVSLILTAGIEVTIRLYLAPPMLRLMHEKYKIEGAVGSGQEIGNIVQGDLILCPHYQRIHKAFRRIHMMVAMGNIAILLATCLHLYFLASKIQIS